MFPTSKNAGKRQKQSFLDAKSHLVNQGYQTDFEQTPTLAIDVKARKIAFIEPSTESYDFYDLSDILEWEHQWVNKTNTSQNLLNGNVIRLKDSQESNVLVFKTNNPHKPLYKVAIGSHANGETWMARLNALVNG